MNSKEIIGRRILVVGDMMVDTYHSGTVSRISPEAPIPVVRVSNSYSTLGGAANVARNISALRSRPIVVGARGEDANGQLMESLFQQLQIECHLSLTDYPTITKTRIVGNRQQVVRVDFESSDMQFSPAFYQPVLSQVDQHLDDTDMVVISDYGKGFCSNFLCQQIISKAKKAKKQVIVDPKGSDWEKYKGADIITPNLKELSDVIGKVVPNEDKAVEQAARSLESRFEIAAVLVTRSEKGMTLVSGEEVIHLRTEAREVFDVSGAGDTVVATLAVALGSGLSMRESMVLANRAAGIVVGKAGTQPILLEELNAAKEGNSSRKLVDVNTLQERLRQVKAQGGKVVFTNGCFDVLHAGHVTYLQKARQLGDLLVVGLNTDVSVKRLKGPSRPINNEWARAVVLASLSCVDYVVLFEEDTPYDLIKAVRPDILVKGSDYKVEDVVGREFASEVRLIDFVEGYSSTKIIKAI